MIPDWLALWGTVIVGGSAFLFGYRQFHLHRIQIRQANAEAVTAKKADMGATLMTLGTSKHRLRIFNKGKSSARHVRLVFPEGQDFLIDSDLESKFPMETMHPHQPVDLIASWTHGTKSKQVVKIVWDDDFAKNNEVITYTTF